MNTLNSIILWFVGILLTGIITILFSEPIKFLLINAFGGIIQKKTARIKGYWKASMGRTPDKTEIILLKQFGNYIIGKSIFSRMNPTYKIKGHILRDSYFYGTWTHIGINDYRCGTFQLVLEEDCEKMTGNWTGIENNEVIVGDWDWVFYTRKLTKEDINKYKKSIINKSS